jgi:hypothetical protein
MRLPRRSLSILTAACILLVLTSLAIAQRYRYGRSWEDVGRGDVPMWEVEPRFREDIFTFVRIKYDSHGYRRGGGWATDYRDSDLNFSLRLQQFPSFTSSNRGR